MSVSEAEAETLSIAAYCVTFGLLVMSPVVHIYLSTFDIERNFPTRSVLASACLTDMSRDTKITDRSNEIRRRQTLKANDTVWQRESGQGSPYERDESTILV